MKINPEEIIDYITKYCDKNTRIYMGADSERYKKNGKWFADYTVAVIVHKNGKNGGKVFGEVSTEPVYDLKANKPAMRLMTEVYKLTAVYLDLAPLLDEYPIELHIDINPKLDAGSSCVINEAVGYIRGMCGLEPKAKPDGFAATYTADRLKEIMSMQKEAA
jgi:predicted RNase H-related nuclease YkuK (DUF458 family)